MRQSVEADTSGLKVLLRDLAVAKTDLEMQINSMRDELASMKENHGEVGQRRPQSGWDPKVPRPVLIVFTCNDNLHLCSYCYEK